MSNEVDYFEIGSPDPQASMAFYGELFGWQVSAEPSEVGYRMVNESLLGPRPALTAAR